MSFQEKLIVNSGKKFKWSDWDPDATHGYSKEDAVAETEKLVRKLDDLQDVFYAEHKRALLIVLQGMDGSGKDGTIKHVMAGVNPQGCDVYSFKQPTHEELDHDFLWRVHRQTPPRGKFVIFNRSHYEDVLVVRVHNLVSKDIWKERYDHINAFEKLLTDNNTIVLKFFLHISKDEQKKRFSSRHDDPKKTWKISDADEAERKFWSQYERAYEDVLSKCSPKNAPWFVIPSNQKWFRNLAISRVVVDTLDGLNLRYPKKSA